MNETVVQPKNLHAELPMDKIAEFCRRWKVSKLEVFGSVLRDDFRADSDIDFLVSFLPDAQWSLLDEVRLEEELRTLVGRRIDVVSRWGIEHSKNWIRRREILGSVQPLYVAG